MFDFISKSFQSHLNTNFFFIIKLCLKKKIKLFFYLCHYHVFGSFIFALNDVYKTFFFTVSSSIQMK